MAKVALKKLREAYPHSTILLALFTAHLAELIEEAEQLIAERGESLRLSGDLVEYEDHLMDLEDIAGALWGFRILYSAVSASIPPALCNLPRSHREVSQ